MSNPMSRRLCIFLLVGAAGLMVIWVDLPAILGAVGRAWQVSDQLSHADAAAVLGGSTGTRPAAAVQLYESGLVSQILVSSAGITSSHQDNPDYDELIRLGIPAAAISIFGHDPKNTFQEANALALWARKNHTRRIIVPAELFTSRRFKWILEQELGKVGTEVMVEAVAPTGYDLDNWWQPRHGVSDFETELVKYLYYRLVYWRS